MTTRVSETREPNANILSLAMTTSRKEGPSQLEEASISGHFGHRGDSSGAAAWDGAAHADALARELNAVRRMASLPQSRGRPSFRAVEVGEWGFVTGLQ